VTINASGCADTANGSSMDASRAAYDRDLQRVTVLQNSGNACVSCGGWGYVVFRTMDYAKAQCPKCNGTGEAIPSPKETLPNG